MACLEWQTVPGLLPLVQNSIPPQIVPREYRLNVDKIKYIQSTLSCNHQTKQCKLGTKQLFKQGFTKVWFEVINIFKTTT